MAKNYRAFQQWDHWLTQFLGVNVLETEREFLSLVLAQRYGKHILLLGVPHQHILLQKTVISHQVVLSPLINKHKNTDYIEGGFYELPIASGSIDVVIVPHSLEYIDNPRQLLTEACRIVKPEGYMMVLGFNPFSFWGLKKSWMKSRHIPWSGNFHSMGTVKTWLKLADFELVEQHIFLFRPPVQNQRVYKKLKFLEWMGRRLYAPFGGIYLLIAKAKVIPLTPIKLHWKQKLSTLQVTIPGSSSMRNFKVPQ